MIESILATIWSMPSWPFSIIAHLSKWVLYYILFLSGWFVIAMWHLSRRHQIRDKSTVLYYGLLVIDAAGFIGDVLANYTWFSLLLLDLPRFNRREITMSQHMGRINDSWIRVEKPSFRQRWAHGIAFAVCRQLNKRDPSGHHC